MCNHYRNHPEAIEDWRSYIGWSLPDAHEPFSEIRIDIWPKYPAIVGRMTPDRGPIMDVMTWGVPGTAPGKKPGTRVKTNTTNVRNLASPFWRSMLAHSGQRCVVPFTEFAEPKPGKDPETGRPAEWWFSMVDGRRGGFAGIWRYAEERGENVFAFLTTEPNPLVAPLHPKAMPVLLVEEDYDQWLTADWKDAEHLVQPYPSQLMSVR